MLSGEPLSEHWRIDQIDQAKHWVYLISDHSPVIKKFGLPEPILHARIDGDHVLVTCQDSAVWQIHISDGARRKLYPTVG